MKFHVFILYFMIPGSKVINHDVLAQEWLYDLMTRRDIIVGAFAPNIILSLYEKI